MTSTHDYDVAFKLGEHLTDRDVLVGESGGLSAVYANQGAALGAVVVVTEHGSLYLDPNSSYTVLADPEDADTELLSVSAWKTRNGIADQMRRTEEHSVGEPDQKKYVSDLAYYLVASGDSLMEGSGVFDELTAIHTALTRGSNMTQANVAFISLCRRLGIDGDVAFT